MLDLTLFTGEPTGPCWRWNLGQVFIFVSHVGLGGGGGCFGGTGNPQRSTLSIPLSKATSTLLHLFDCIRPLVFLGPKTKSSKDFEELHIEATKCPALLTGSHG